MDTPRENSFDRILFTLAQVTRSPMAAISFIDDDRVWAKALVGRLMKERPRCQSLTHVGSQLGGQVVLEDTFEDQRFAPLAPLETGEVIRALLMVPIFGPTGELIGNLSAVTGFPRRYTNNHLDTARQLAKEARESLLIRAPGIDVSRIKLARPCLWMPSSQRQLKSYDDVRHWNWLLTVRHVTIDLRDIMRIGACQK